MWPFNEVPASVSDLFVAASSGISIISAVGTFIWKIMIKPGRDFKKNVNDSLKKIQDQLRTIERRSLDAVDGAKQDIQDLRSDMEHEAELGKLERTHLREDMDVYIVKSDQKNEKLLDTLLEYFNKE